MSQNYLHPDYLKIVNEFMDIADHTTRRTLLAIDEADQNKVLLGLTGRLYEIISDKSTEVDFGEIPKTKGVVRALPNYDKLTETLGLLESICREFRQDTKNNVEVINVALANLASREDMFTRAFKLNIEMPILMYNTIYLSIIHATSLMVSTSIEYIKAPLEETYQIALDKTALVKTEQGLLFDNLRKFNEACRKGDFDKAMDMVIKQNVKNFSGIDDILLFGSGLALVTLVFNIIPIMRELIYFFYFTRVRVSDYFDLQADLLTMNAQNIEYNSTKTAVEKKQIRNKQLKIAELFRKAADKIAVDSKQAEVKATKEITSNDKKLKLNDVSDGNFDSAIAAGIDTDAGKSVLF